MIRTTYKGRALKIRAARGKPGHVRTEVGGKTISHGWAGTEIQALDNLRTIIDQLDAKGGPGHNPHDTTPHWYEPGTYRLNGFGHAVPLDGGGCPYDLCLMWPAKNVPVEVVA